MKLQGMFAAAATPFDHTGALYRTKVQHNFEKSCRTSLAGFVIGSLAGEGPLLEPPEKIELLRLARSSVPDNRTIIADISAEGVQIAVTASRAAADAGANAVVSIVPHQYRNLMHGQHAAALFFRALADRSSLPLLIHNAPRTAGIDLRPETIAKVAAHPNIVGVIETGAAARIAELRAVVPKEFAVLAGAEAYVWESLKSGANGAALAFASAAPYATIAIWEAFRTREEEAGTDWQGRITDPAMLVTEVYGPAGLKHAMDLNGYYGGPPRCPLPPLSKEARLEIEEAFRDLKG